MTYTFILYLLFCFFVCLPYYSVAHAVPYYFIYIIFLSTTFILFSLVLLFYYFDHYLCFHLHLFLICAFQHALIAHILLKYAYLRSHPRAQPLKPSNCNGFSLKRSIFRFKRLLLNKGIIYPLISSLLWCFYYFPSFRYR